MGCAGMRTRSSKPARAVERVTEWGADARGPAPAVGAGGPQRLPVDEHQEDLGWHDDLDCVLVRAKLWYKTAKPCAYCCETRLSTSIATAMSTITTEKLRRN